MLFNFIGCGTNSSYSSGTNAYYPTPCPAYNNYLRPLPEGNESYAVYESFLSHIRFNDRTMVIRNSALSGSIENIQWLEKYVPASNETVEDFNGKEKQSEKLENYFDICGNVVLIDAEEINRFTTSKESWNKFRLKYSQARGITTFSKVGFSKDRTKALVGVKIICGEDCGMSNFFYFEKNNGKWSAYETAAVFIPNSD